MQTVPLKHNSRFHLFGVLLLVLSLAGCKVANNPPVAQAGSIDVSGWNFTGSETLHLNGEWLFYWDQLLTPQTLASARDEQTTPVPGMWNEQPHPHDPSKSVGATGNATYVLKINGLNKDTPQLAIQIPPVATAYELFWFQDGAPLPTEPLMRRGVVHPTHPIPKWTPDVITLPKTQGDSILMLRMSNRHFGQGGFFYPFVSLHENDQLRLDFDRLAFLSIGIIGVILMMALYHFGLFAVRREDVASLIFAAFCLLMVTQAMAYRHWVTLLVFTDLELWCFDLELALMSLTTFVALPLFVSFLTKIFPEEFPRWFEKATWVIGVTLVTAYPFLGLETNITVIYGALSTFQGLFLLTYLVRSIRAQREGAHLVLVGFLLLFTSTTLDMLITQQVIRVSLVLTPFGLLGFILAQSMILSKRFASAYQRAEHLSQHLQTEVKSRTRELELKTLEAIEASQEAVTAKGALESAHHQLQLLDRQKTSFFQNVSHELRTPLTLILNPVEQALKRDPHNEELEVVLRNGRRLLKLVNQLLNFQKLQAGKMELNLVPIDAAKFAVSTEGYFSSACAVKDISFRTQVPSASTTVLAEVDALEKIVFNFLSNALKFTPDGGKIELALTSDERRVRFAVKDTGPGIPPTARDRLFEVFSQLEDTSGRPREGSGLGLALARELATQMNGTVGFESVEGEGSTFWVELPVDTRSPVEAQAYGDSSSEQLAREITMQVPALDTTATPADIHSPLILVVDDLPDMLRLITKLLAESGYRTITARHGIEALEIAKREKPQLIVTDWMMPQMAGPELIRAIRDDSEISGTPITLLTAKSDEDSRILGTEIGADAFVGKPFNEQELTSTVRNLLALKENERALVIAYDDLKASSAREMGHMRNLLSQAEQLASLGQLIAGIGHEIANPVSLANLTAEEQSDLIDELERMLMSVFEGEEEKVPVSTSLLEQLDTMRENLSNTRVAVGRLKDLSLALRTQSRREMTPSDVLISEIIDESLTLVGSKTKHLQIQCEFDELPPMTCFRTQVGQVLTNLLANAADAVNERVLQERDAGSRGFRGRISIKASLSSADGHDGICVLVTDNGSGVDDAIAQSIFDEFFTTKPAGAGTGLGLSMSMKIVKHHGGTLKVSRSEELDGAEFALWLPLVCQMPDQPATENTTIA